MLCLISFTSTTLLPYSSCSLAPMVFCFRKHTSCASPAWVRIEVYIEVMPVISCPSPIYDALRKSCGKSLLQKLLPNSFGRLCPWRGRPSADDQSAALSITVACIIRWCLTGAKVMLPKQRHAVRWGFHFGEWFQHIPRIPWKDLIS